MNYANYHILKVSVLGPTNTKPARVSVKSERFKQSIIIPFTNDAGGNPTEETIQNWAKVNGFEIIGKGEGKDCFYFISDTFAPLKRDPERMKKVISANGYDYYVGENKAGEKFYNLVPEGKPKPSGGYSAEYICSIKNVPNLF